MTRFEWIQRWKMQWANIFHDYSLDFEWLADQHYEKDKDIAPEKSAIDWYNHCINERYLD